MFKRMISLIATLTILSGTLVGCKPTNKEPEVPKGAVIASYIRENADGTETFMVDDKPFLYLGVETRTEAFTNCDRTTYAEYEKYFKAAADIGFNVMAVSVDWADIETSKDVYDFDVINKILGFGLKYGIKVELLWYSALMCGTTHEWHIPKYIFDETPRYQMFTDGIEKEYVNISTIYGTETFLRIDDKTYMERETKVVKEIMSHVYDWEEAREFPKVLIGIQVYNEVDAFPEKNLEKYEVSIDGVKQTKDQVWNTICTAMDNCAKAFKSSKYQVITRTNLLRPESGDLSVSGISPMARAKQVYDLANIDCVGYDPYFNNLTDIKTSIDVYQNALPKNFTHIAENGRPNAGTKTDDNDQTITDEGQYINPDGEILVSISKNCGYIIYELASPMQFVTEGYGQGIIDAFTLEDFSYTETIRKITTAFRKVSPIAGDTNPDDFAVFNADSSSGKTVWTDKVIYTTKLSFDFDTSKGAKGFAIVKDGYAYIYSTDESTIAIGNGVLGEATFGSFVNGAWVSEGNATLTDNVLVPENDKVYRIKIETVNGALTSNTELFKG